MPSKLVSVEVELVSECLEQSGRRLGVSSYSEEAFGGYPRLLPWRTCVVLMNVRVRQTKAAQAKIKCGAKARDE